METTIKKLSELVDFVAEIGRRSNNLLMFRGEQMDHGDTALVPLVYRGYIQHEDIIYRESQRFNDMDFNSDRSVFDRLSRIQHYTAPTRLIDVSEDLFSAAYFAISDKDTSKDKTDGIIYVFEIKKSEIRYYDSDTVTVVSNLAKIPLINTNNKSKRKLLKDIIAHLNDKKKFNKTSSASYLLHEIKHEKPHFSNLIVPEHLTSVQFVLPKLTNSRIRSQKGAFLLFGLNPYNCEEPIRLLKSGKLNTSITDVKHPILEIHKAHFDSNFIEAMQKELVSIGIKKSFIYPEIDKVSEYLKTVYKQKP
ncbi:MAG: FRG domain-containing protein [Geobacteraceae bacterium]|nr:FRG domain-containing protein [Geobacteraceae bacterium]